MERRVDIALHGARERIHAQIGQQRVDFTVLINGIVDEQIDTAELREHRVGGAVQRCQIHQVHGVCEHLATGFADLRGGGFQTAGEQRSIGLAQLVCVLRAFGQRACGDRHAPALACKVDGGGGTDASACAGDEKYGSAHADKSCLLF